MMANYKMNFSDGTLYFEVEPYAANGPESPSNEALFRTATSADTSLAIVGKYFENYGERIQENLIHLLENFAMDEEPVFPVGGQIWYDRSQNPPRPRIYNLKKSVNESVKIDEIRIKGNHIVRFNNLIMKHRKLRIFSNSNYQSEDYAISSPRHDKHKNITTVSVPSKLDGSRLNWYVGGWDDIIISSNGVTNLDGTELQNVSIDDNVITDSTNPKYNPKAVLNISQLENFISSLNLQTHDGLDDSTFANPINRQVIAYDQSSKKWKNLSINDVIKHSGNITLGGNLDLNGRRITGVKTADGKVGHEVVTVNYLKSIMGSFVQIDQSETGSSSIENLADIKDVNGNRVTYDPTDPNSDEIPEINETNSLLYYDGGVWNKLPRKEFSNVGILSLDGTSKYNISTNPPSIQDVASLEPDALLNYNSNSTFINDVTDFVNTIDDNVLVSKGMGEELWGSGSVASKGKVLYGNYDGYNISLGYQENIKPEETNSYLPDDGFVPKNPEGVVFKLDVFDSIHVALDPKTFEDEDDLYFESSLAKVVDEYPEIKLSKIIEIINRDLGDISAYPFRELITAPSPNGYSKGDDLIFDDFYTVGKSTLSVYEDGKKLYASIPNSLTCELIEPTIPNDSEAQILDKNGKGTKSYEIVEINDDDISISGNEEERFSELITLEQTVTISEENPIQQYKVSSSRYDTQKRQTILSLSLPSNHKGISKGNHIVVENIANTKGKIWGGFPTGLKVSTHHGEKHLYQFDVSTDFHLKTQTWKTVVIEGKKNVAQVVQAINDWSNEHDGGFSAFIERGKMGFISARPGKDSVIRVKSSQSVSKDLPIISVYDCDGINSPCDASLNKTPEEISLLKGKGFIITGSSHASIFPEGTTFEVSGSTGNDGTYTVKSIDTNICGENPVKNEFNIYVTSNTATKAKVTVDGGPATSNYTFDVIITIERPGFKDFEPVTYSIGRIHVSDKKENKNNTPEQVAIKVQELFKSYTSDHFENTPKIYSSHEKDIDVTLKSGYVMTNIKFESVTDEVTIRVKEENVITDLNPTNMGTIALSTRSLFDEMTGGVVGSKHYYYKINIDNAQDWKEKFYAPDLDQEGDYIEIGNPGTSSDIIKFNKDIPKEAKLEIIINSTLNA